MLLPTVSRVVRIKDVVADLGISESCLQNWLTQADRDDGIRSGPTSDENARVRVFVSVRRKLEADRHSRSAEPPCWRRLFGRRL